MPRRIGQAAKTRTIASRQARTDWCLRAHGSTYDGGTNSPTARKERNRNHGANARRIAAMVGYQTGTVISPSCASTVPRRRRNAFLKFPQTAYQAISHRQTRVEMQMRAVAPGFTRWVSFRAMSEGSSTQFSPEKLDTRPSKLVEGVRVPTSSFRNTRNSIDEFGAFNDLRCSATSIMRGEASQARTETPSFARKRASSPVPQFSSRT